jgi:hypothetical protein
MPDVIADCGFGEPHEPHEYVVAGPDGRPLDLPCPGLAAPSLAAQVVPGLREALDLAIDAFDPMAPDWPDFGKSIAGLEALKSVRRALRDL